MNTYYMQFCAAVYSGTSGGTIGVFCRATIDWMKIHKHSAVLVTLMAHSAVSTGETVYVTPFSTDDLYAPVDKVSILCA